MNTPGNSVYADFRAVFNPGNLTQRPDSFMVSYRVTNAQGVGQVIERDFPNRPGG
jgi:predicted lysophospholipase L1 biosynthesis ABC-type transport system permease subunit